MKQPKNYNYYVYKVMGFGITKYFVSLDKKYPGDSIFSFNKNEAKLMTSLQAIRLTRKLNSGIDEGRFRPYGYGS